MEGNILDLKFTPPIPSSPSPILLSKTFYWFLKTAYGLSLLSYDCPWSFLIWSVQIKHWFLRVRKWEHNKWVQEWKKEHEWERDQARVKEYKRE